MPKHSGDRSHQKKLPISRGRYQLIPVLSDLFNKKSFSGHKLDQTFRENHLTVEDRKLFTELFYGFLRFGHRLLFFVDKFLGQPEKVPDKVKWIIAIGFYQKLNLSKIPEHALVNEAVEMTKRFVGEKPFPDLVNAVLRKFLQNVHLFEELDDYPLWVQTSFPEWMCEYLSDQWGQMQFFKMSEALNTRSPTYIRVNATKISEEKLMMKLKKEGLNCSQTGLPNCLVLTDLNKAPKEIPGYHEGLWTIQNMSSQRVVKYLDVQEGDEILDACCGFGGKTLQMAEDIKDKATIHYFDIVEKKMNAVQIRSQQMGFKHVKPVIENQFGEYDRILIDAPCSGLGTIASHPEIKWFRTMTDLEEQRHKQMEVLESYSKFLKPGGSMLYAVCSIDKNEGENIIKKFLENHTDFEFDDEFKTPFEDVEFGSYLMPSEKGETGYFISRIKKKA